jgi:hypothetical protein
MLERKQAQWLVFPPSPPRTKNFGTKWEKWGRTENGPMMMRSAKNPAEEQLDSDCKNKE